MIECFQYVAKINSLEIKGPHSSLNLTMVKDNYKENEHFSTIISARAKFCSVLILYHEKKSYEFKRICQRCYFKQFRVCMRYAMLQTQKL